MMAIPIQASNIYSYKILCKLHKNLTKQLHDKTKLLPKLSFMAMKFTFACESHVYCIFAIASLTLCSYLLVQEAEASYHLAASLISLSVPK